MYLHGALFMLAIALGVGDNTHVRVDILYNRRSPEQRAWIDLVGHILFLLPVAWYDWYNDSKSTNCESTVAALNTLERDIILIIGGSHKIIDYKYLSEEINQRVKKIIFVGQNKEILKSELSLKIDSYDAHDYEDAVNLIMSLVSSGDKVLLSPASPSFDMFNDFEHRGDTFKKVVKKYVS